MSAMTNILIKDDAATPTEWTFIPISDTPSPYWRTNASGIPLDGQLRFTASAIKQKNGKWKLSAKLEVPVMETLGASGTSSGYVAPQKVAYTTPVIVTMFADSRSTSQDRANALRLMVGVLQGATSATATGTLANNAVGQSFLNSTAPIVSLFTSAIVPN